ncbi:hypothetical protein Q8A67_012797 [Cirrhinus molitorella]|uniref:Uncharacterized protein n=1 Tax=Cirrhinus molitorella TaxID=172907 RepID=A0AA88PMY3_9TELE|nr:hypothetical protein Q8A67_012797 [Cirrhinus molitorella]
MFTALPAALNNNNKQEGTEKHKINTAILEHKAAKGRHLWVVVWSPLVHSFCKCFQLRWERPAPAQLLRTDLPLTAGGTESFSNARSTRIHMTLKYFFETNFQPWNQLELEEPLHQSTRGAFGVETEAGATVVPLEK